MSRDLSHISRMLLLDSLFTAINTDSLSHQDHIIIMAHSPSLPEAILSAIADGDITQLQTSFQTNMPLEEVAKQAARDKQPDVLEWCYSQGWYPPPESLNDNFFIAVLDGMSPAIFQVLFNHGWDSNAHESEACGDALASAVISGEYECAKWLLEQGHRSTPHDPMHGETAITSTVRGNSASINMLKLLLEHGIDLDDEGAAVAAADEGNLEALKLLLDHGVDLEDCQMMWYPFDVEYDEPEESQGTALYRACRQGHLECVKLLLDRGANAQAVDNGNTSCLDIAKKRGHHQIVQLLQSRG